MVATSASRGAHTISMGGGARRQRLRLVISDEDGGQVEIRMPWAVAECMLGREATLREAGFSSVSDLDGHMREWTAARHPVTDPQPCC